jgi:hypothetical protein
VITLPNPQVTPNWQTYAPADCQSDPNVCADDHRFWEEWDFSTFAQAIDSSFAVIASQGKYNGIMLLMPLTDSPTFWSNLQLMYDSAASHNLALQAVLFPKSKYNVANVSGPDAETCYLYSSNAPGTCQTVTGTTTAVAYQKLLKLMNFVENLGGGCSGGASRRPFAVWYGWSTLPGYQVLSDFWKSLPTSPCNLQASYITWLDTGYSSAPEVAQLQTYVTQTLGKPYWVNTELYSSAQIQGSATRYLPYQTVITGYYAATTTADWAQGMCAKWNTAGQPGQMGFWTFYDRDVISLIEQYRAYINGSMAVASTICQP